MAKVVLDMSMSLDGYISGSQDDAEHPMGLDGHRLHDWLADGPGDPATYRPDDPSGEVFDEMEIHVVDAPGIIHLHYRVRRKG